MSLKVREEQRRFGSNLQYLKEKLNWATAEKETVIRILLWKQTRAVFLYVEIVNNIDGLHNISNWVPVLFLGCHNA